MNNPVIKERNILLPLFQSQFVSIPERDFQVAVPI
jgi:hypothetical protein